MDIGDTSDQNGSSHSRLFVGGIPPFYLFETAFHSLFHLVESQKNEPLFHGTNPASKAALISLVAHFEAFCKHQFAALINTWPLLLSDFATKRPQSSITLLDLATLLDRIHEQIGFVVAEQYDFGSATKINGLFRDLVKVTPFSTNDGSRFDSILTKRNLLVHHAGYYTLRHLKESDLAAEIHDRAFKDCVSIATDDYHQMGDFLFEMSMKITRATVVGLQRKWKATHGNMPSPVGALQQLLTGVHDILDEVAEAAEADGDGFPP